MSEALTLKFGVDDNGLVKTIAGINKQTKSLSQSLASDIKKSLANYKQGILDIKNAKKAGLDISQAKEQLARLKSNIAQASKARLELSVKEASAKIASLKGEILATVASGAVLGKSLSDAMSYEDALLNLKSASSFNSKEELDGFGKAISQISTKLNIASPELLNFSARLAELGVKKEQLKDFVDLGARMQVGFGLSSDKSIELLRSLKLLSGGGAGEVEVLADKIKYLSVKSGQDVASLLEIVAKSGELGKQAGLSAETVASFGAVLRNGGLNASEASATFDKLINSLTQLDEENAPKGFKKLNMDVMDFKAAMAKDANSAITEFLSKINRLKDGDKNEALSAIFGAKQAAKVRLLADRLEELKESYKTINDSASASGALNGEVAVANEKLSSKLGKLKNSLFNISAAIGESLKPAISALVDLIAPILNAVTSLIQNCPRLTSFITIGTAAILGLKSAFLAFRVAGLGASIILNSLRASMMGLNLAMLANPAGLLLAALVGAATVIYHYWGELKAFFGGFFDGLKEGFAPVMPIFEAIGAALSWIGELFAGLFEKQEASRESLEDISSAGKRVGEIVGGVLSYLFSFVQKLIDGFKWVGDGVSGIIDSVKDSSVFKWIFGDDKKDEGTKGEISRIKDSAKNSYTQNQSQTSQSITDNKQIIINMQGQDATPAAVAAAVSANSYSFED